MAKRKKKRAKKPTTVKAPRGSRVGEVLFPLKWGQKRAGAWAKKNSFKLTGSWHKDKSYWRRRADPGPGDWEFVGSKKLKNGVVLRFVRPVKKGKTKATKKHPADRKPERLKEAIAARKEFAGLVEGVEVRKRSLPKMDALILVGTLPEVIYRSDKFDGRKRLYRHRFKRAAEPQLLLHPSGAYFVIVPRGRAKFKMSARGIE